jgi:hypothetical protein
MFEAANPFRAPDYGADSALRPLGWHELVARIAAARDTRELFARPALHGGGFVPHAAAGIGRGLTGERGINLGSLSDSKWPDVTRAAAAPTAGHGERDKR